MSLFTKNKSFIKIRNKQLINWNEPNGDGCIVSDKITKEGYKVGYMYRNKPNSKYPDSGWQFLVGNEDEDYMKDNDNHHVWKLNSVCNYDEDIIPYLHSPIGTALIRVPGGKFEKDDGSKAISIEKQNK